MAGGKFDKLAGKTRPGTYINFQSERTDTVGTSERGTTIIPLMKPAYGPAGTYIELTNAGPDAAYAKLGFSVYDSDTNRQMLLIREAFKNASKVLIYIVKDGTKAKATNETAPTLTATAKYGGSRGNALTVTVAANPVEGFDVTVSLAGDTVAFYEGLSTVDDLIAKNCEYVTFTGSGALTAVAAMNLTGGTDATPQNSDVTAFLDTLGASSSTPSPFPPPTAACRRPSRRRSNICVKAWAAVYRPSFLTLLQTTRALSPSRMATPSTMTTCPLLKPVHGWQAQPLARPTPKA